MIGRKSLSDEELAKACFERPECRRKFVEMVRDDVEDVMKRVFVSAVRLAVERPPVWWQWLFLLAAGALAGIGIGYYLAASGTPPVPPPG